MLHATIYGTLFVAFIQGTLGGLMFWWLGLPSPLLWGVVMGMQWLIDRRLTRSAADDTLRADGAFRHGGCRWRKKSARQFRRMDR